MSQAGRSEAKSLRRSTGSGQRQKDDQGLPQRQRVVLRSYSETGSSRDLLREAIRGNLKIVVSQHVLEEAERSLAEKAPAALPAFHELLTLVAGEVAEKPTLKELKEAATYINLKDGPIVAAAVKAQVDYLVTWDRKHFIRDPRVGEKSGLTIITPDELMAILKEQR